MELEKPPERIVSLVPSLTESFFDLGLGHLVVGITDYCIYPEERVGLLPKVGGPKNVRVETVLNLNPDLVVANQEENTREVVEALRLAGVRVWLTFPKTVRETLQDLWNIVRMCRADAAGEMLLNLERSLEWAELAAGDMAARRYFCPIWQGEADGGRRWWMTFNSQTYPADLLSLFGYHNIFAGRMRRYPLEADLGLAEGEAAGEKDVRYPCVTLEEALALSPEVILLPSEPYCYSAADLKTFYSIFGTTPAAAHRRIKLVDGTLLMWSGTRLGKALALLPELLLCEG